MVSKYLDLDLKEVPCIYDETKARKDLSSEAVRIATVSDFQEEIELTRKRH